MCDLITLISLISLIIGLVGLIATLVGTYLSYISFINPMIRFSKYLRKHKNWEELQGIKNHLTIYRHKKYPNFQIIIDWDKPVVENFHEDWINNSLYPDKGNNASFFVRLEAHSMLLDKTLFVSLDGHRNFVPVPKILTTEENKRELYYDKQQVQLAKIIGRYGVKKSIYEFAEECSRAISFKE